MRAGAAPRYPWSVALARTGRRTARLAKAVARVTKRRPGRRIRLDNDARRAQLLELGQKAFAERTYDEVSIDDIARAAGVSKGLLYHYYPTKRDFYLAGLRRTADELVAKVLAASEGKAPIDRVRAGLDAYLDHVLEQAAPFVALMRGGIGSDPEVAAVIEDTRGRLLGRIMTDGAGHPGGPLTPLLDRPLMRIALRGWLGLVEAASLEWLASGPGARQHREALREFLVAMLQATIAAAAAQRA